jgi:hypothetical protein
VHDKNLHTNKGLSEHYPDPEIGVDEAWEEMKILLEKDSDRIPPLIPPVPTSIKGIGKFWVLLLLLLCMGTAAIVKYVFLGSTKETSYQPNKTVTSEIETIRKKQQVPVETTKQDTALASKVKKSSTTEKNALVSHQAKAGRHKMIIPDTIPQESNSTIHYRYKSINLQDTGIKKTNNSTDLIVRHKHPVSVSRQKNTAVRKVLSNEKLIHTKKNGAYVISGRDLTSKTGSHSKKNIKNHRYQVYINGPATRSGLKHVEKTGAYSKKSGGIKENTADYNEKMAHHRMQTTRKSISYKHQGSITDNKTNSIKKEKPVTNPTSTSEDNPENGNFKSLFYQHLNEGIRMPDQFSVASSFPDTINKDSNKLNGKIGRPHPRITFAKPNKATTRNKHSNGLALAAGLGLNQFFSIGGQQASGYNSNGTSNGVTDYIPVPMARLYFNKKTYIQVEAQFNTPQYTKNLLAKQVTTTDSLGTIPSSSQQSIFIKKLFYFNLPVSLHYSPMNNLYIGAGVQYARLSNGVGLFQNTKLGQGTTPDSTIFSKIGSFKTDPVYKELKTTEWRFLLDANYQLNNWVLGIRYNQALRNFINITISSNQITQSRNSSLQLYLRYTIWNSKKTKAIFSK